MAEQDERGGEMERRRAEEAERAQTTADEEAPFGPFDSGTWMAAQFRSGPLPSSDEFRGYEMTYAGSAERILQLAERAMDLTEGEASHRRAVETAIVNANIQNQSRGQMIATTFGLIGFAAAIVFVALGLNVAAFIAVLVPLGAFISRFIRRNGG